MMSERGEEAAVAVGVCDGGSSCGLGAAAVLEALRASELAGAKPDAANAEAANAQTGFGGAVVELTTDNKNDGGGGYVESVIWPTWDHI